MIWRGKLDTGAAADLSEIGAWEILAVMEVDWIASNHRI